MRAWGIFGLLDLFGGSVPERKITFRNKDGEVIEGIAINEEDKMLVVVVLPKERKWYLFGFFASETWLIPNDDPCIIRLEPFPEGYKTPEKDFYNRTT